MARGPTSPRPTSDTGSITDCKLYQLCLNAKPNSAEWFSIADTGTRLLGTVRAFYTFLATEPVSLLRFAYGWNSLWYGRAFGFALTLCLPMLPAVLMLVELTKRLNEKLNPWVEADWKIAGPGRVFFVRPEAFVASLFWDFYLALSVFCGSFLQYGTDRDGLMHTWYDETCVKEFWLDLLDEVSAKRPRQLASWDGATAHDVGPGVAYGKSALVCKISDSYLGIGDKILKRGEDFTCLADIQALLAADPMYAGKKAILAEFITPDPTITVSSPGFGNVHSLDIVTTRTKNGVKILTVLLWTDCDSWSSHSCTAGYLVDVDTETVVAPTAWYSPYFAKQQSSLLGTKLPGVKEACEKAVAAHSATALPWLTTVGWDAMLTADGVYFFEGNVAAYRTPRRMFLTPELTTAFFSEFRGEGSPVPWLFGARRPRAEKKAWIGG